MVGSGTDSSWTWAPDLSTVCHTAHCCSRVTCASQDNFPASKDLLLSPGLVSAGPTGLVHRTAAVIAVPQGDSACQCEQGRKATRGGTSVTSP